MNRVLFKSMLGVSTALGLIQTAPAFAQATPGDRSGTPTAAGAGQSAATTTNAPAPTAAPRQAEEGNADIVVTARRVEERLQDVPISITVFNQQQISNKNLVNASDLAAFTPSLSTNTNYGNEFSSFALRGFVQDPATAPSVGVYFADVVALRGPTQGTQAGDGAGPGSFFDLQNVQVLKGPQGTLQGRNTTGGAVLFVPQKPTSRLEGFVEGSYGNYDSKRIQGAVNIPLSETARFRIAGDYMNRDGWLKNRSGIGPVGFNDVNYYSIRASLVVDLTPDLENYFIASYTHSNTNGSSKKQIACLPASSLGALFACPQLAREAAAGYGYYDFSQNLTNPKSRIDSFQLINTTTWRASDDLTIKNIASYGQLSIFQRSPLFGNDWRLPAVFGPAAGTPINGVGIINPDTNRKGVDQSTFTEELQFQGNGLGGKLTWQAGAYLEVSDPLSETGGLSPVLLVCANANAFRCSNPLGAGALNLSTGKTSFRDVGLYTQATYSLTEQLKLTGGFRYTWDRETNSSTKVTYGFTNTGVFTGGGCTDTLGTTAAQAYNGNNCRFTVEQKSKAPTWLIDLDYKPIDDVLVYAKWSRGYRAGGLSVNLPAGTRTFRPEKVEAYEVGLKSTFRDFLHSTFNVAGFYNDFSNQQVQAGYLPAPGRSVSPTAGPINAGKSRIYGAEVEASIRPFRGFTIDASYTYLKTKIRSISAITLTDPNYIVSFAILPGNPLPLAPKNKLSLSGHYTLPLASSIGQITFGGTFTHTDKQLTTYQYVNNLALQAQVGGDLGTIPSYNLVSLDAQWKGMFGTPIDLSLFATNVTQKKYINYVGGLAGAGFETANIGDPRFYGVRLRYTFGR